MLETNFILFNLFFYRGNKGLIIINADTDILNADITTGLPEGIYCDVISGNYEDGNCTGNIVQVDQMGQPHFTIDGQSDDPVVAIHIGESSMKLYAGLDKQKQKMSVKLKIFSYQSV